MGCFIRKKKDGSNEYFYEVTTTYDPAIKRSRQKVKYLGKNIGGRPARVRTCKPYRALNYGELLPALHVLEELGLKKMLDDLLVENDSRVLEVMALNRVLRPVPSMILESWYESSYLCKMYPDLKIKSQSISDLLERTGSHGVHEEFMDRLVKKENGSALVFDITSLSSYSRQIGLLEYGYNREGVDLEQVNLGLVVDKKKGIPLMYDLYPGSIVDVLTLVNTLRRVRARGIREYILVLDRGFYSRNNVKEMIREGASFIIPGSSTLKSVKEIIAGCKDIKDPSYLQKYNGKPLFVKPIQLDMEDAGLSGYLYYNPGREQDEKEAFLSRLYDVRSKLVEKRLQSWMNPNDVFEDTAGGMKSFFSCKVEDDHFRVVVRNNAVSMRLNRMGRFILLYHGVTPSWDECLSMYREKDIAEKAFKAIKNDIRLRPLNVKKTETLQGLLLACFIALIIRMRLLRIMKEKGLLKKYTLESMFLELEKIKKIELENGEYITTEQTKKQREILETLGLTP